MWGGEERVGTGATSLGIITDSESQQREQRRVCIGRHHRKLDWSSQWCTDRNHRGQWRRKWLQTQWPNAVKKSNRMKPEGRLIEVTEGASERKLCER